MWAKPLGLEWRSRFEGRAGWKARAPCAPAWGRLPFGGHEMRRRAPRVSLLGIQERCVCMCVCVGERPGGEAETAQRKTKRDNRHAEKLEVTGETQGREGEGDPRAGGGRGLLATADIPEAASCPSVPAGWPLRPFQGGMGEIGLPRLPSSPLPALLLLAPGTRTHFATHSAGDEQAHPSRRTRLQ